MIKGANDSSCDFRCEWMPSHLNENGKDSFIIYSNNFTQGPVFAYNWNGSTVNGWHTFFLNTENYLSPGMQVSSVEEDLEYPAGSQNDLLSSLFSTTPFEKKTEAVAVKEFEQISKPAITDIEELPRPSWSGTTVPNTGSVEKIYINTNLNKDEVINLFRDIDYDPDNDDSYYCVFSGAGSKYTEIRFGVTTDDNGVSFVIINVKTSNASVDNIIFTSADGWSNFDNPVNINDDCYLENGNPFCGEQNELLSSLFSITPFEKIEPNVDPNLDPNYLYRTPDNTIYQLTSKTIEINEWVGTPVPNSGTITKWYINNNLSIEEVKNIVAKLEIDADENFGQYLISDNADDSCSISVFTNGVEIAIAAYFPNINEPITIFASNEEYGYGVVGFNSEITNFTFDVNYESVSEINGMIVGDKNELLSGLISITPFEKKTEVIKEFKLEQISKPAIIDVKELPSIVGKWVGTPIPAHGFIDKVYFNKNLTKEETLAILDSVQTNGDYHFAKNNNYNVSAYSGYHLGYSRSSGYDFVCLFDASGTYGGDGWASDCPEYVELGFEASEYSEYGKYNEQLSSLVSSTPFEYIEPATINEGVLYRTPDGGLYSYKSNKFVKLITSDDNIGTDPEVLDAIGDLYSNYDNLNSTVNSIKSVNDSQGTSITNLNTKVNALETQIGNINTILDAINGEEV